MLLNLALLLITLILFLPMVYAAKRFAPPLSTKPRDIQRMIELASIPQGGLVYDLGCGAGQLLLGAARWSKAGRIAGVELSPLHALLATFNTLRSPERKRLRVKWGNFMQVSLREADTVLLFITPTGLERLVPKLTSELKSGARVVSYAFPIRDWTPASVSQPTPHDLPVYLYER